MAENILKALESKNLDENTINFQKERLLELLKQARNKNYGETIMQESDFGNGRYNKQPTEITVYILRSSGVEVKRTTFGHKMTGSPGDPKEIQYQDFVGDLSVDDMKTLAGNLKRKGY